MYGCGRILPEFAEILARPVQAALHRADSQIERLGDFFLRKVVPVAHHDRSSIGRIQRLHHKMYLFALFATHSFGLRMKHMNVRYRKSGFFVLIYRENRQLAFPLAVNTIMSRN